MSPRPEEEEEERELLEGEASVWGYEEQPPLPEEDRPPTPYRTPGTPQATPKRQVGMPSPGIIASPLWDVEVCAPAMIRKCRRIGTPEPQSHIRYTPQLSMCSSSMPQHAAAPVFFKLHIGVWRHAAACCSIQIFEFMCLSACSCSVCTGHILPAPCLPSLFLFVLS